MAFDLSLQEIYATMNIKTHLKHCSNAVHVAVHVAVQLAVHVAVHVFVYVTRTRARAHARAGFLFLI